MPNKGECVCTVFTNKQLVRVYWAKTDNTHALEILLICTAEFRWTRASNSEYTVGISKPALEPVIEKIEAAEGKKLTLVQMIVTYWVQQLSTKRSDGGWKRQQTPLTSLNYQIEWQKHAIKGCGGTDPQKRRKSFKYERGECQQRVTTWFATSKFLVSLVETIRSFPRLCLPY